MRITFYVWAFLPLALSVSIMSACTSSPPANSNQPQVTSNRNTGNASQANASENKSSQSAQSTTGTIEVSSTPPGARVLLVSDDEGGAGEPQSKGITPTTITGVAPGAYTVDLEKPGYRFVQKKVVVKAGKTARVSASLKKQ